MNTSSIQSSVLGFVLVALGVAMPLVPLEFLQAQDPACDSSGAPVLSFAQGLPGKQVRLSWTATPGHRYRVEKSPDLSPGSWKLLALVDAEQADAIWRDPEAVSQRGFYRVTEPAAEVFSLNPPLLSPAGGTITVHGQCIPDGSQLVVEIEGVGQVSAPLLFLVAGQWTATLPPGSYPPGARVISARVVHGGATLATIDQQIEITATGLALDGPVAQPPAAPVPVFASKPVPSIGIVVKKNPGSSAARSGLIVGKEECDDGNLDSGDGCSALLAAYASRKGYQYYMAKSDLAASRSYSTRDDEDCDDKDPTSGPDELMGFWLSKKGYDYYKAQSDMASSALQTNPYFVSSPHSGTMPSTPSMHSSRPAASGLPGEVSFQVCDLSLPCPAGPPLAWVRTYRSMKPVVSGHGPQWDFSYNIWIEPLPSTAGPAAPRLVLHDGGGRSDILYRQADGTYRCDGMFREGAFSGGVFTLTFADRGKWTFNELNASTAAGKISSITDRFGVALTCGYDTSGRLLSVTDSFSPPRSLTVHWSGSSISSIQDSSGRSVSFAQYAAGESGGVAGDLKQATPQGFGPTVYTYSTGSADDRLNHNLLEIRDGENRLLEGFSYSPDASGISYDTCASHNRNRELKGHVTLIKREMMPPGTSPRGGYAVYEIDEIGRVNETVFDAMHRVVRLREYTGYWEPGTAVGSADLGSPVAPKTRAADPDFYETSAKFNADHQCTQLTRPDGSQLRITYDRDLRPGCPVRERGNARSLTIRSASGEERTVSCDYLPGFGTPEPSARPGNPIGGISIKGGRNPGGLLGSSNRPGNPIGGLSVKGGKNPKPGDGALVWSPRSNFLEDDSDGDGYSANAARKGWDGKIKGSNIIDETARHTPFQNPYQPKGSARHGIAGGAVAGIVVAAVIATRDGGGPADDCDDASPYAGSSRTKYKGWDGTIKNIRACDGFVTRMVNAYGQTVSWGYDDNGACTSMSIASLPQYGKLYQYNQRGQCTGSTVLNGPDSSFTDEMIYDPATGFLSSVVCDKSSAGTGLQLTATLHRDSLGRVIRMVDPMNADWLYEYNSLDQCTRMQSPGPHRISVNLTYDNAGRIVRRDQDHLGADGTPVSSNPAYSTFYRYDGRARLNQIADEERPVDGSSATDAASLGIENFAVCDIARDPAGQIVSLGTPAACRAQSSDLSCNFAYDERGKLFRCTSGGSVSTNPVTMQWDYHPDGSLSRRAIVGSGVPDSAESYGYDGFHRVTSVTDALGVMTHLSYDNVGFTDVSVYSSPNPATGTGELMSLWRMRKRPEVLFQAGENEIEDYLASSAFFDYLTEDDTVVADRFTPGSPDGAVATETTVVDRSPAGLVQSITLNGDLLVANEYDSAGRLVRCSNGACRVDFTRDGRGRILVCGRTDHFRVAGAPPSESYTDTYARDSLGRVIQRTDGAGNVWTAAYDSFGRCVSSTAPGRLPVLHAYDGTGVHGDFSRQTSCDVSGSGTPVVLGSSLVRCGDLVSTTDSYGQSTGRTYDELGRLSACAYPDNTTETLSYNGRGFVSGCTYRDGTSVSVSTDILGRVTGMGWPGNPAVYQYDALGRCVLASQGSSIVAIAFDSLGNPVSETQSGASSAPQQVLRSYNHRGRKLVTYPGGAAFSESRDEFGNLLSVSAVGAPLASPPVVSFEYVGQRVWRSTQANGVVAVHNYRSDGEASPAGADDKSFDTCVSSTVSGPGAVVMSRILTHRSPDQSVSRVDTYFAEGNAAPGRRQIFSRDNLARVTSCLTQVRSTAGGPVTTESEVAYALDAEGQRLSEIRNSTAGAYTLSDALPPGDRQAGQYTTWPGGPLTWDDAGNLLSMQKGSSSMDFVYDAQGRLVACNHPGGAGLPPVPVAEFVYDALGRVMIHRIHRGGDLPSIDETRYVYDGGACVQELASSGLVSTSFVRADGEMQSFSNSRGQYFVSNRGLQHWGERSICPGGGRAWPTSGFFVSLVTNGSGLPSERFDCDDACKPVFLDAAGAPTSGSASSTGMRWMVPECLWVPETAMFHGQGSVCSPDLGRCVSREKDKPFFMPVEEACASKHTKTGHVTLMK